MRKWRSSGFVICFTVQWFIAGNLQQLTICVVLCNNIEIRSKLFSILGFITSMVEFYFFLTALPLSQMIWGKVFGVSQQPEQNVSVQLVYQMCVQCTEFYKTSFGFYIYDLRSIKDRVHVVTILCCCFLVATTLRKRQISALFYHVCVSKSLLMPIGC